MEINEIEVNLAALPDLIEDKANEAEEARNLWKVSKQKAENRACEIYLACKAEDPELTQGELKAKAVTGSNLLELDAICFESKYNKLKIELTGLRDKLDTTLEASYNWRCTVKKFNG